MKKMLRIFIILLATFLLVSCESIIATTPKAIIDFDLVYSKTSNMKAHGLIDNYTDYSNKYEELMFEEKFFETHLIYTYSFMNNYQGKNIYLLDKYEIKNNDLVVTLKEGSGNVDTAFGNYLLIFSISKEYYKSFNEINIEGIYEHEEERFQLTVIDEQELIINNLDEYYIEGEEITIQTNSYNDLGLLLYVNGEYHSAQTVVLNDGSYIWEYYLTMPDHDIEISFDFYVDQTEEG